MKKLVIALSTVLALGAVGTASAQSGTITFNGNVTATTCEVQFPGNGGAVSDPTVTLPIVTAASLSQPGIAAGRKPVMIQIGTSTAPCSIGNTVALELNPTRNAQLTEGRLTNLAPVDSAATNVVVALRDANDAEIDLRVPWQSARETFDNGIATIAFSGEYYATGAATAGEVTANVQYTLDYQ